MNSYIHFIKKYRKVLFVSIILANIFAILGIIQLKISSDFNIFTSSDSMHNENIDDMNNHFPSSSQIIIMTESDQFDKETYNKLREFQSHIENIDGVESVNGPAPSKIAIGVNVLDTKSLTDNEFLLVKQYLTSFGDYSSVKTEGGILYSNFVIYIDDTFDKANINEIENYADQHDLKVYITGDLYNQVKIIDILIKILFILPPCALLVVLIIFRTQMKSFKATLLSALPAGLGALWVMGLLGWIGKEVSIITVVAPIFTIVIGSADGLHFLSHIQETKKEGMNKEKGIINTLELVGIPMIITTITSVVGFLSLLTLKTSTMIDLVVVASIGITFAGIATWFVLPLILVGNIGFKDGKLPNIFGFLYGSIRKIWGYKIVLLTSLLIIISGLFIPKIKHEFNMLMIYKDYTEVYKNNEKIMDIQGGSTPVYLYLKVDGNPLYNEQFNEINVLLNRLKDSDRVSKVSSVYDFISLINKKNTNQDTYPNDIMVDQIYGMLKANNPQINEMVNIEEKVIRFLVFPQSLENQTLVEIENIVEDYNKETNKEVIITGIQYAMKDLNEEMASSQYISIIIALLLVFLSMLISLRNIKVAIYSVVPILLTVLFLYGFLGMSGISLNVMTITIFSITIGVGIDYAVHYSSIYKSYLKDSNKEEAAKKAYKLTSKPIIANALGLSIGLSVLLFSPLTIHFNVSVLIFVSMIISVFLSLSLLPTLLIVKTKKA